MKPIERAARLFADINELLISSGANTRRVELPLRKFLFTRCYRPYCAG